MKKLFHAKRNCESFRFETILFVFLSMQTTSSNFSVCFKCSWFSGKFVWSLMDEIIRSFIYFIKIHCVNEIVSSGWNIWRCLWTEMSEVKKDLSLKSDWEKSVFLWSNAINSIPQNKIRFRSLSMCIFNRSYTKKSQRILRFKYFLNRAWFCVENVKYHKMDEQISRFNTLQNAEIIDSNLLLDSENYWKNQHRHRKRSHFWILFWTLFARSHLGWLWMSIKFWIFIIDDLLIGTYQKRRLFLNRHKTVNDLRTEVSSAQKSLLAQRSFLNQCDTFGFRPPELIWNFSIKIFIMEIWSKQLLHVLF